MRKPEFDSRKIYEKVCKSFPNLIFEEDHISLGDTYFFAETELVEDSFINIWLAMESYESECKNELCMKIQLEQEGFVIKEDYLTDQWSYDDVIRSIIGLVSEYLIDLKTMISEVEKRIECTLT